MTLQDLLDEEVRLSEEIDKLRQRQSYFQTQIQKLERTYKSYLSDSVTLENNIDTLKKARAISLNSYRQTVFVLNKRRASMESIDISIKGLRRMSSENDEVIDRLESCLLKNLSQQSEYGRVYLFSTHHNR